MTTTSLILFRGAQVAMISLFAFGGLYVSPLDLAFRSLEAAEMVMLLVLLVWLGWPLLGRARPADSAKALRRQMLSMALITLLSFANIYMTYHGFKLEGLSLADIEVLLALSMVPYFLFFFGSELLTEHRFVLNRESDCHD